MQSYEYTAIPAPLRADKVKGVKDGAERYAKTFARVLNEMAAERWEFLRAETLPCEERTGFTSKAMIIQHLLVFRRPRAVAAPEAREEAANADARPARSLSARAEEGIAPRLGPAD